MRRQTGCCMTHVVYLWAFFMTSSGPRSAGNAVDRVRSSLMAVRLHVFLHACLCRLGLEDIKIPGLILNSPFVPRRRQNLAPCCHAAPRITGPRPGTWHPPFDVPAYVLVFQHPCRAPVTPVRSSLSCSIPSLQILRIPTGVSGGEGDITATMRTSSTGPHLHLRRTTQTEQRAHIG